MKFSSSTIANLVRNNQFDFKACAEKFSQECVTEKNRNNKISADQVRIAFAKKTGSRERPAMSADAAKGKKLCY